MSYPVGAGLAPARIPMVESSVLFFDVFNNAIGGADITAAQALAGNTASWEIQLYNQSRYAISWIYVWIDLCVDYIKISDDDSTWVQPAGLARTKPSDALLIGSASPGSTASFYMQRIIPAATAARRRVTTILHWTYFGGPD